MATTTSRTEKYYEAFRLDEKALKSIGLIVQYESYEKRWAVECNGGIQHYCASVDDILKIPNIKGQEIKRIVLRTSDNAPVQTEIDFRRADRDTTGHIAYTIKADSDGALVKSDKVKQFIIGQREWYGRVPLLRWSSSFWLDALALWGFTSALWFLYRIILWDREFQAAIKKPHFTSLPPLEAVLSWKIILVFGIVALVLTASVEYLFPNANFLIGAGRDRYQQLKFVRGSVFAALIIGIVASVIANFIHS